MTLNPSFEQDLLALLPRLRRFAVGLCGNPADGDDLCQMTIERALANRQAQSLIVRDRGVAWGEALRLLG